MQEKVTELLNEQQQKVWAVLERKTNDQSEQRAISGVNLGVEESNFDSMKFQV